MSTPSLPSRYRLLGLLGEGGSGRVYRVHDSVRSRHLALKLVTGDEGAFLRREFDTLRQIRHENLIQVFDWGSLGSAGSYYTMELIEGEDWGRGMGRPQGAEEVRRILTGLLRGLAHLHCHREIHGDLKPGNVLLGLGGVVKLTDVGMGGADDRAERASGTPGYAAPETWEESPADVRSDLYSVGVMAYEALTGVHPFAGKTIRDVVAGQLEGWVPSPGAHGVRVPPDLERVVMRALERDPDLRQGSADEFMEGMGVEDRVGQILGGRFVGREPEIGAVMGVLYASHSGSPSLIHVVGPPQVGKGAFLDEVGHRLVQRGGAVVDLDKWELAGNGISGPDAEPSTAGDALPSTRIGAQAEYLLSLATTGPVLVRAREGLISSSTSASRAHALARYLWAISIERDQPARVLLLDARDEVPEAPEEFAQAITLSSLDSVETTQLIRGRLGEARLEPEFFETIHRSSGGFPGAVDTLISSLVSRGLVERRRGAWSFREMERLDSIDLAQLPNPWSRAWDRLRPSGTRVLQTLCLVAHGLPLPSIALLSAADDLPAEVAALAAKGWLVQVGSTWRVASEGIRHVVRSRSDVHSLRDAALSLVRIPGAVSEDEAADLALEFNPSIEAVEAAVAAASRARSKGNHSQEVSRLRRCLEIAKDHLTFAESRSIAIDLADALHRIGADAEAREELLREDLWANEVDDRRLARRHSILGTVEFSLGNVEDSRRSYERGRELARGAGDLVSEARCVAGLAEAGWQHGGESLRTEAIDLIEALIRRRGDEPALADEMGSLIYHLGSALVRAGEHERAAAILRRGLESGAGEYWRMRIANALAAATYYVGRFDAALESLELAWRLAEHIGADSFKSRILANRAGLYYGLGRPGDAVDQQVLAAVWARRTGATFDYLSACAGASINLVLLAQYEEAISFATQVREAAKRLGDVDEIGKGFELEALSMYYIGDYPEAEGLVRAALGELEGVGYISVRPRLEWLLGRTLDAQGRAREAAEALKRAEAELKRTQDWEDLPGVQIELHRIASRSEDAKGHLAAIHRLVEESRRKPPLLVILNAALAVAEILVEGNVDHRDWVDFLRTGLARAEGAGIREGAWRLSSALGSLHVREGNHKEGLVRFRTGAQLLREVAGQLSPRHRESYLATRHARSLLNAMGAG